MSCWEALFASQAIGKLGNNPQTKQRFSCFRFIMGHPHQRVARSLTRFGRPPPIKKPLPRNWRSRLPIPHVNIIGREFVPCRLENHYYTTLQDNAIVGPAHRHGNCAFTYDPSNPYARFRHNPPVGGSQLGKKPPPASTPDNVVRLEKIVLHSFMKQAISSRSNLLGLIMAMRAITGETEKALGKHAVAGVQIVRGKKSVGGWIRPNIPVGAKVELRGAPMYDFIGQLAEFVLPRLKDFHGIVLPPPSETSNSPSAVSGVVSIGLTPAAMQYFPQIEVNLDSYPRSYGMHIHFVTNATGVGAENRARALLSGFQLPFIRHLK
ncbi:60s ribosomal protein l7 [Mycena rebaudengoi]|nr:60s ribosomal protein l7 [Mycena rebaudengoi]